MSKNRGNSSMEEKNLLDNLALKAQRFPAKSKERQRYLERLIQEIQKFYQLRCSNKHNENPSIYLEICNEATQQTYLEICRGIDKYKPEQGAFLGWVKTVHKFRCIDAWKEYHNIKDVQEKNQKKMIYVESLNKPIQGSQQSNSGTLDITLLDTLEQPKPELSHEEELWKLLEQDPTGNFQHHIKNHPEATFQKIALRKLEGKSWKEISEEWAIAIPTLSSFYERNLKKFQPIFKQYL